MGWKMRNRVPTDAALKAYDDRMAEREYEIRRPGRKINVISNEDYAEMLAGIDEARAKLEELQMLWQSKHLDTIRQRNDLIRYKLFLIFKENFNTDTSNADTVSKQPLARAIAAVCNSITKDSVAYIYLTGLSKDGDVPWYDGLLRDYVQESLGIVIDRDDILSVRKAVKEKKTMLELISSQVKRDLEEVTAALKLHQKLSSIPKYSDPKVAENINSVVLECIDEVDESMLQTDGAQSQKDDIEKQYVAELHEVLDEAVIDHGTVDNTEGYPTRLMLDTEQLKALKSLLNTKASIRAFFDFWADTEWSKSVEGLSEEKKVLESLLGPDSDAILRTINETIADTYLASNRLVEESAEIRNALCTNRGGGYGMMAEVPPDVAANIENFEKACKEENAKFQDMENDTAYKKLFTGISLSGADDYRNVRMFTMSGYM